MKNFRYQILIEYDGSFFNGWQIQTKGKTVQKSIQTAISKILKEKIILIGSSRTDSGVHAIEQSAHFDTNFEILNKNKFLGSLNFFLNKKQISIIEIKKKNKNFHSRYSAKKRIYKYVIFNRKSKPSLFLNKGWFVIKKLDIKNLKKGASILEGTHDFNAYRSSKCSSKSSIKKIDYVRVSKTKNIITITFKSQSYLMQQVRCMVGCLKYLGEKKWNLSKFEKVLLSKKRSLCAPPAPPHGLFLEKVIY